MGHVPRNGYISYSMPCVTSLGPGPNRRSTLEIKRAAELKCGLIKTLHVREPDDHSPGRDSPDCYYNAVPLEFYKERSTSFKMAPRVPIQVSMPRIDRSEQPAWVQRLYNKKLECQSSGDPWWYVPLPYGGASGLKTPKHSRSAPTLPDTNYVYRQPPPPPKQKSPAIKPHQPRRPQSAAPTGKQSDGALQAELKKARKKAAEADRLAREVEELRQQLEAERQAHQSGRPMSASR